MVNVSEQVRMQWQGRWIWANYPVARKSSYDPVLPAEQNVFLLLRKTFSVQDPIKKAILRITADSRYKLFVNGQYIGRGINRCEAYYWYYNEYDITSALTLGNNVIAIHARFFGMEFAYYTAPEMPGTNKKNSGKGGVLFDLELVSKDRTIWLGSDNTTKILINPAEKSNVLLRSRTLGFTEVCDSRNLPANWNERDFDDTLWKNAELYEYPIKTLILDENAPLYEKFYSPKELIKLGQNEDPIADMDEEEVANDIDFCTQANVEGTPEPLQDFEIRNVDALLGKEGICDIIPKAGAKGKSLTLFFRFEKEMVGYPRIRVTAPKSTIIDIMCSEKTDPDTMIPNLMNQKHGFRLYTRGGSQFFEQWDYEGFLYMLVKIRNLTDPMQIHALGTNFTHMQVQKKGSFFCENQKLNQLWEACAHSVLCCAIDGYFDCPSREQRSYLGDAYPEALIANACFGEPRLTKKLILDSCFGQRPDGIMMSFHPGDARRECHVIPDYTLYLIQITKDYYQYYGDESILENTLSHFQRAIEWFWKYLDPTTHLLKDVDYWCFIDWSFPHDKPGIWGILNAQFQDVLEFVAWMGDKYGQGPWQKKYRDQAALIRKTLNNLLWNESEGCYFDYFHENRQIGLSQMTNAYLCSMKITSPQQAARVITRIFDYPGALENDKSQIDDYYLAKISHHDFGNLLKGKIVVAQPFFMHHVNRFFAGMGRYDLLMKYLHKWEPMLDLGKTGTIWETWSIDRSECHAWAATPAYDLSTYWLGVKPDEPGFKSVIISPTFFELSSVKGIFPSCRGNIEVSWEKNAKSEGTEVRVVIKLPESIQKGVFVVPLLNGKKIQTIISKSTILDEPCKKVAIGSGITEIRLQY